MCCCTLSWYCLWVKITIELPLSAGSIFKRCVLVFRFLWVNWRWGWRLDFAVGGECKRWVTSCAMDDCMPSGRCLTAGWMWDAMSVVGSFFGVGVNFSPNDRRLVSSKVSFSSERLIIKIQYYNALLITRSMQFWQSTPRIAVYWLLESDAKVCFETTFYF